MLLALLQNGYLVSGCDDSTIYIWDTNSGVKVNTLTGNTNMVRALVVLQNGYIASACYDNFIRIWN